MRFQHLFTHTTKEAPRGEVSRNAQLLTRAGYIDRLMAGVYSFLPLGLRVLQNIEEIVRQEMNGLGAQEVLLPALHPKEVWTQTGRWESMDVLYKLDSKGGSEFDLALAPTHEEVVTPLGARFIQSYRDLPFAVYQIQTKFRNELRARSGLLRGREFRMKDMYSFHAEQTDLDEFYERAIHAYTRIYERCGLGSRTVLTYASGGTFSKYSHEFQTITEYGEDVVYRAAGGNVAINKELIQDTQAVAEIIPGYTPDMLSQLEELKAIEVGNIFKLGQRFSAAIQKTYADQSGASKPILMGCYGLGPSRVLGTIAECLSDDKGLVWPKEIAPFQVHLVGIGRSEAEIKQTDELYEQLTAAGIDTLYDDRPGARPGEKLSDSDLIGIPNRVVVSSKTLAQSAVELKLRDATEAKLMPTAELITRLQS